MKEKEAQKTQMPHLEVPHPRRPGPSSREHRKAGPGPCNNLGTPRLRASRLLEEMEGSITLKEHPKPTSTSQVKEYPTRLCLATVLLFPECLS